MSFHDNRYENKIEVFLGLLIQSPAICTLVNEFKFFVYFTNRKSNNSVFDQFVYNRILVKRTFIDTTMTSSRPSVFLLKMIGEIETAEFVNEEELYFTYLYCYGQDWEVVKGIEEGSSQTTRRSEDERRVFVWNFPLDVTFKSTNPFGWPQLVICLYGLDSFGNDVIRGYAVCHLPISPGRYTKRLPTFVPASASTLQRFVSWLSARRPEFVDPKTIAQGNGREVIRVTSEGSVSITFDVIFKDFSKLGYNSGQMQRNKIDSIISTNVKEVDPDLQQPSTSKGFRKQNS